MLKFPFPSNVVSFFTNLSPLLENTSENWSVIFGLKAGINIFLRRLHMGTEKMDILYCPLRSYV